ncbi:unnamed protein product, partial [Phaeothamnion confervicola]
DLEVSLRAITSSEPAGAVPRAVDGTDTCWADQVPRAESAPSAAGPSRPDRQVHAAPTAADGRPSWVGRFITHSARFMLSAEAADRVAEPDHSALWNGRRCATLKEGWRGGHEVTGTRTIICMGVVLSSFAGPLQICTNQTMPANQSGCERNAGRAGCVP